MTTAVDLTEAKGRAQRAWYLFTEDRLEAIVPSWRTRMADDGAPLPSVEVVGADAVQALHRLTTQLGNARRARLLLAGAYMVRAAQLRSA